MASGLGSMMVASTIGPVFWPATAVTFSGTPVSAGSLTVAVPAERHRRAAGVGYHDRRGVVAGQGIGVGPQGVECTGRAGPRRWWPCWERVPSPQSMVAVKSRRRSGGVGIGEGARPRFREESAPCSASGPPGMPGASGASAMTARAAPATVSGAVALLSVIATTTWYVPARERVKAGALTVYWAASPFWVMVAPGMKVDVPARSTTERVAAYSAAGLAPPVSTNVAIGAGGMASPSVPTMGKTVRTSGLWVTVAVAVDPGRRRDGAKAHRHRGAVDRCGDRAAGESDRLSDSKGPRLAERVRAGDLVAARVGRVLGDRASGGIGSRVAPVDRCGKAAGRKAWRLARRGRKDRRQWERERPDGGIDRVEPFDAADHPGGARDDRQRPDVEDLDLLVADGVDGARAGFRDQHLAAHRTGRDDRIAASRVDR